MAGRLELALGKSNVEENSRARRLRRQRWCFLIFLGCIVAILIFIGIVTPLLLLRDADTTHAKRINAAELVIVDRVGQVFRTALLEAFSAARLFEGNVMSQLEFLPKLSDPPLKRLEGQSFPHFPELAELVLGALPNIAIVVLAPGGVFMDTFPREPRGYGRDIMNESDRVNEWQPTPMEVLLGGKTAVTSPFRSTLASMMDEWSITVRTPVFNFSANAATQKTIDNFWGFVSVGLNISNIMEANHVNELLEENNMDYLLFGTDRDDTDYPVYTSLGNLSQNELEAFIHDGVGGDRFLPSTNLSFVVQSRDRGKRLSSKNVTLVVCMGVLAALILFAALSSVIICYTESHNSAPYAPKLAPYALLSINVMDAARMWAAAPEAMTHYVDAIMDVFKKCAREHHAYDLGQRRPYTHSYVARTPDALVHMGFSLIERLHRHPIEGKLRKALASVGAHDMDHPFTLCCMVHWCTDAQVLIDPVSRGYAYSGKDVERGCDLLNHAVPGTVTLSRAAADALSPMLVHEVEMREVAMIHTNSSTSSGGECSEDEDVLLTVTDPASRTLREARERAVEVVAYVAQHTRTYETIKPPLQLPDDSVPMHGGRRWQQMLASQRAAAGVGNHSPSSRGSLGSQLALNSYSYSSNVERDSTAASDVPMEGKEAHGSSDSQQGSAENEAALTAKAPILNDSQMIAPPESSMADQTLAAATHSPPLTQKRHNGHHSTKRPPRMITTDDGDVVSRMLAQPQIAPWLDSALHIAFDRQAVATELRYSSVRVLIYYFYCSYRLLLRPLASVERENIYRRLVTAFGVPQQGILENLAARCVIRHMQQHEEVWSLLWDYQLRERSSKSHLGLTSDPVLQPQLATTAAASISELHADGLLADSDAHPPLDGGQ